MSLLPFLLDLERSRRLYDQEFGLVLTPEDVLTNASPLQSNNYYRPWKLLSTILRDTGSTIKTDIDKFQINLDVQHFSPEDISVKTVDGFLVVDGRHEEKQDEHGWVSRQFCRRYTLPEGCNLDAVESRLSSDGVLTVTAPRYRRAAVNERIVPIIQTGPVKKRIDGCGEGEKPVENRE